MPTRRRALFILAALTGLALVSIALALLAGSVHISADIEFFTPEETESS